MELTQIILVQSSPHCYFGSLAVLEKQFVVLQQRLGLTVAAVALLVVLVAVAAVVVVEIVAPPFVVLFESIMLTYSCKIKTPCMLPHIKQTLFILDTKFTLYFLLLDRSISFELLFQLGSSLIDPVLLQEET